MARDDTKSYTAVLASVLKACAIGCCSQGPQGPQDPVGDLLRHWAYPDSRSPPTRQGGRSFRGVPCCTHDDQRRWNCQADLALFDTLAAADRRGILAGIRLAVVGRRID